MENTRKAYEAEVEAKLVEWNAEVSRLRSHPELVQEGQFGDKQTQLDKLQGQLEMAEQHLRDLEAEESSETWHQLRNGMDKKMMMLEQSFAKKIVPESAIH